MIEMAPLSEGEAAEHFAEKGLAGPLFCLKLLGYKEKGELVKIYY